MSALEEIEITVQKKIKIPVVGEEKYLIVGYSTDGNHGVIAQVSCAHTAEQIWTMLDATLVVYLIDAHTGATLMRPESSDSSGRYPTDLF